MHKFAEELIVTIIAFHQEYLAERDNLPSEDVSAIRNVLEDFTNTVAVTLEDRF